jgi:nucleoside 2-deoxyribosyltransferase
VKLIYVAGKYTGKDFDEIEGHIQAARSFAVEIWRRGHVAICPHLNTYHFEQNLNLTQEDYYERDFMILQRCDGLFAMPNWKDSRGAQMEVQFAHEQGIPVYFDLDDIRSCDNG